MCSTKNESTEKYDCDKAKIHSCCRLPDLDEDTDNKLTAKAPSQEKYVLFAVYFSTHKFISDLFLTKYHVVLKNKPKHIQLSFKTKDTTNADAPS